MRQKQKELKTESRKLKVLGVVALLTFIFSFSNVLAQESVNTTGGKATGSGGSASYSVVQVVYTAIAGINGSVVQGVQQPYEISVASGVEEAKEITLSVSAYPNPTTDFLQLEINHEMLKDLSFQLYDMNGKILQSGKITENRTRIAIGNLVPAVYLVKVMQGNKEVIIFKTIKK